jgi:hypothetical protein
MQELSVRCEVLRKEGEEARLAEDKHKKIVRKLQKVSGEWKRKWRRSKQKQQTTAEVSGSKHKQHKLQGTTNQNAQMSNNGR